jgi:tRNA (guanine6-N2)-methyltransferase
VRLVWQVECEALPGLEELLGQEVQRRLGAGESLRFRFSRPLAELLQLRLAHGVYLVVAAAGARPTALLGHENLQRLRAAIDAALSLHPPGVFRSFRFSAAGSDTSTFRRLAAAVEGISSLPLEPEAGDLLLRVRRGRSGWETLVRLTPRPLSARHWRVRNLAGALNAGIAAAMVELTGPRRGDRFANLACGSGTLLAERLLRCRAEEAIGYEIEAAPLEAAHANLAAAGLGRQAVLVRADATSLPRRDASLDAMVADLPYGDLMGSHAANAALYPALLREAARVAATNARLVVITQEVRLLESCLAEAGSPWLVERRIRVLQGGHRPLLAVLRRRVPASRS